LRWIALVAGVALVALAVGAVTRVADTHEGLVAEIVTLLSALAGISLLIYALTARPRPRAAAPPLSPAARPAPSGPRPRVRRDLVLGSGGLALALVLLAGLAISGGALWASLGLALLLPMIAGSVYLCLRFLRSEP
jgi:hypothetical protein